MSGPRCSWRGVSRRAAGTLLGLLFLAPGTAHGVGLEVDFREAISRAMRNNPALSAAGQEWTAAKKDADAARGSLLPSVTLEERFIRTNVPAEAFAFRINQERLLQSDFASVDNFNKPPPVNEFLTALSAEQPLFAPKAYLGFRMATREAGARGEDLRRKTEEVAFRVLTAYLGVLTAKEYAQLANQGLADAREHHRIAEAVEASGMGLLSDVLRAKVFLAAAESGKVTAENRLSLARRGLALAMGEKGGAAADASAPLPPLPEDGSLDDLVEGASARSDLRALAMRVENAGANVTLQRSDYLPVIGLTGAYQLDGRDGLFSPDNRSYRFGVGLRWNLFDGFRREAAAARAAAESGRVKAEYRGAQDHAVFQVTQAFLSVTEARQRLAIARSAVSAAEEGTRLIRARYENQLARMVDLLDAQTALNAARADLVRAENDLRQSRAELLYASGTMLPWALSGHDNK